MRHLILAVILIALVYASCETTPKEPAAASTETNVATPPVNEMLTYCCSMHPEVTGKKGDKCSKCSMELTEIVAQGGTNDEANTQVFACSMHPEVTGKKGDKCSKCEMALTEVVKK
jgi:hypothetical protein